MLLALLYSAVPDVLSAAGQPYSSYHFSFRSAESRTFAGVARPSEKKTVRGGRRRWRWRPGKCCRRFCSLSMLGLQDNNRLQHDGGNVCSLRQTVQDGRLKLSSRATSAKKHLRLTLLETSTLSSFLQSGIQAKMGMLPAEYRSGVHCDGAGSRISVSGILGSSCAFRSAQSSDY